MQVAERTEFFLQLPWSSSNIMQFVASRIVAIQCSRALFQASFLKSLNKQQYHGSHTPQISAAVAYTSNMPHKTMPVTLYAEMTQIRIYIIHS